MTTQTLYIHCEALRPESLIFSTVDMSKDPDWGQGLVLLETREVVVVLPDDLNQRIQATLERQLEEARSNVTAATLRRIQTAEASLDRFLSTHPSEVPDHAT